MSVRSGKGDKGFTSISFCSRISKDAPEIHAIGDIDEINSYLGLIKSKVKSSREKAMLEKLQHALFSMATEISIGHDDKKKLGELLKKDDIEWIAKKLVTLERKTEVKSTFYVPGEGELSAHFDIARAVSRRAERNAVALYRKGKIKNENIISYLNCLSDLLFVMARKKAHSERKLKARRIKK